MLPPQTHSVAAAAALLIVFTLALQPTTTYAQVAAGDPCTAFNANDALVPYSTALACIDSIAVPPAATRKIVLDTTATILQLYPYYDIVRSSPEPRFKVSVDIAAELQSIETKVQNGTIRTDRGFHEAIYNLFNSFKDTHATYLGCYQWYYWIQPWSLVQEYPNYGILRNGSRTSSENPNKAAPVVRIHSTVVDNWMSRYYYGYKPLFVSGFKSRLSFDINEFVGWEVLEMDGMPAAKYAQKLAEEYRVGSKDMASRFNYPFSGVRFFGGDFVMDDSILAVGRTIPLKPSRTYKLRSPTGNTTTLDVPYLMHMPIDFNSRSKFVWTNNQEFFARVCLKGAYAVPVVGSLAKRHEDGPEARNGTSATMFRNELEQVGDWDNFLSSQSILPFGYDEETSADERMNFMRGVSERAKATIDSLNRQYSSLVISEGSIEQDLSPTKVFADSTTAFYLLPGGKTGVWVFPIVSAGSILDADGKIVAIPGSNATIVWLTNVVTNLKVLQDKGVKNLIIDVTGNTGGSLCASYLFLRLLYTDISFPTLDCRYSRLLETLANASYAASAQFKTSMWSTVDRIDLTTNKTYTSPTWVSPRSPGPPGVSGTYTKIWGDNQCTGFINQWLTDLSKVNYYQGYYSDSSTRVAILTDGNCGSACANFLRPAKAQKNAKVYVWGGGEDSADPPVFQFGGYEGGALISSSSIETSVNSIADGLQRVGSTGVVGAAPGSAESWGNLIVNSTLNPFLVAWTIPASNFYTATRQNRSQEWTYVQSDGVILVKNVTDNVAMWLEVERRLLKTSGAVGFSGLARQAAPLWCALGAVSLIIFGGL
ncbi:hypothetical protein BJ742DRAFT_771110 [Cladochytrium replicatum]|nr:hypothetical protein BJ742DRAFT_771110 [Cladochytrium replicatum]